MLADVEVFYRRVPPNQLSPLTGSELGWRVSSMDWDDREGDPSVYSASMLAAEGLGPEAVLIGHEEYTLVEITAQEIRRQTEKQAKRGITLDVARDPDEEDPLAARGRAHCVITGLPTDNRARKDGKEPLARTGRIIRLGATPER